MIGLVTNWLAVRMTFGPLEYVGLGPFGWQGIIPARAGRMAAIAVDTGIAKLGTVTEIIQFFDPQRVAEHLSLHLDPLVPGLVEQIARAPARRRWWEALPAPARVTLIERVRHRVPDTVHRLLAAVAEQVDDLVDVRMMVVDLMSTDKSLLVRVFRKAGEREFRFLVLSGVGFGIVLGVPQMIGAWLLPAWVPRLLALPAFGLTVGFTTNWLALKMIFEPVEPRRILGVTVQGLFLRRRDEVTEVYCHLITREVLTLRNFLDRMLTGPRCERTHALIREHVGILLDRSMGAARPAVEGAVGTAELAGVRREVEASAVASTTVALTDPIFNEERATVAEQRLVERMVALSPTEFSGMLRPVFRQSEVKLLLVGAALGGVAGILQALLLFRGPT